MSSRATLVSLVAAVAIVALTVWGVLAFRGDGPEVLRAVAVGAGLGLAGSALETVLVGRALRRPRGKALNIVLGGFGVRLLLMAGLAVLFARIGWADPAAFALSYLGGFLAALPVLAAASFRAPALRAGEARP